MTIITLSMATRTKSDKETSAQIKVLVLDVPLRRLEEAARNLQDPFISCNFC